MIKEVPRSKIILLSLSDFAKGIFTGMIANYLLYFFVPTETSGIATRIHQGNIVFGVLSIIGLIKAVGHVIDAFTDPLVANFSDKSRNRTGRRIPYMRWAAVPFGLSALLIFMPPISGVHWVNDVWVAVFIWLYFVFYTVYMIPKEALIPELIPDQKLRLWAYSISSFFFVAGSALIYMTPLPVSLFKKAGMSAIGAYQLTFAILTVIGIVLLIVSSFCLREKDYVESNIASVNLWGALKEAFANKHFRITTAGHLLEYTAMAFFQASIMYYITELVGLSESQAPIILAVSIACSIALYPVTLAVSKRYGKKKPLLAALIIFVVCYLIIFFGADWKMNNMAKAIMLAVLVAYPFAALNILPNAVSADIIQYDTLMSGTNKEGVFSAARSFITKIGQSIAIMIIPSIFVIGSADGKTVNRLGIKITALISAFFCILGVVVYFFYNDKHVTSFIEERKNKLMEEITAQDVSDAE